MVKLVASADGRLNECRPGLLRRPLLGRNQFNTQPELGTRRYTVPDFSMEDVLVLLQSDACSRRERTIYEERRAGWRNIAEDSVPKISSRRVNDVRFAGARIAWFASSVLLRNHNAS